MYEKIVAQLDAEIERLVTARALLGTAGGGSVAPSATPKRRGRKPGSKNKPRQAEPTATAAESTQVAA